MKIFLSVTQVEKIRSGKNLFSNEKTLGFVLSDFPANVSRKRLLRNTVSCGLPCASPAAAHCLSW